jgi:hypothetical protein
MTGEFVAPEASRTWADREVPERESIRSITKLVANFIGDISLQRYWSHGSAITLVRRAGFHRAFYGSWRRLEEENWNHAQIPLLKFKFCCILLELSRRSGTTPGGSGRTGKGPAEILIAGKKNPCNYENVTLLFLTASR